MIIIGAKGFAKEVYEVLFQNHYADQIAFYDDVNEENTGMLFGIPILKNIQQAAAFMSQHGKNFTIGIGNPNLRAMLYRKFTDIGGNYASTISNKAVIGSKDVIIGSGTNILPTAVLSNSVEIGMGGIVYYGAVITHDCRIGDFVEISPSVNVLGRVIIGDFTQLGSNSTILPDIVIGSNVIVGAGAVVTKDIPDNAVVAGVPARITRMN